MLQFWICLSTAALLGGFLLDLLLGDPQGWPHLIRFFGMVIVRFEKLLYPLKNKLLGGLLLVAGVLTVCAGLPAAALCLCWKLSPWAYFALETLLCWQLLAVKSLRTATRPVYDALEGKDLPLARREVSMVVGRDTERLDASGVTRAAVETVAENTSDGVAAPLFYLLLGGAALGCLYKAVNTMDSMVGYKNDRYILFGRCAAKLDDVLNFLPARMCAVTMILAARLCGMDSKAAFRIWKRDRRSHASPNSAQTEAVMAGALGVQLAGDAWYFGVRHQKPTIGDDIRPIEPMDILRSHRLLYATAFTLMGAALLVKGILYAAI